MAMPFKIPYRLKASEFVRPLKRSIPGIKTASTLCRILMTKRLRDRGMERRSKRFIMPVVSHGAA